MAARLLSWNELDETARLIFSLWPGPGELVWARSAWKRLEESDLASFHDPQEHCLACLRFMALGGLFYDFSFLAWGRKRKPAYYRWAERLGVEAYAIGEQLAEEEPEQSIEVGYEEALEAMKNAVDERRPEVYRALREGFGGDRELFRALWNCKGAQPCAPTLQTDDPLGDSSHENSGAQSAFQWITDGCPPQL